MKNNAPAAAPINARLVRSCERAYNAAIRAEEAAETETKAWRLAKASERALRRLQAARAGLPLPVAPAPRTAKNLARGAFAALAAVGRAVARALVTQAALRKAQAALAARKAARLAAGLVRAALRRATRAVARKALALSAPVATVASVTVTPPLAFVPVAFTVRGYVFDELIPVHLIAARVQAQARMNRALAGGTS